MIVLVIIMISSCYIWFKMGYGKGYSDGVDKMFRMFDEEIEQAVREENGSK